MADYHFEEGDDYVTLPPEFFDNMWQPDPYFFNSKVVRKYSKFQGCERALDFLKTVSSLAFLATGLNRS